MEKMMPITLIILFILLSCNQHNHENDVAHEDGIEEMATSEHYSFDSCEYFDEFRLRGVGKANPSDHLFIMNLIDDIIIKKDKQSDSSLIYHREGNGWYNVRYYDFDRDAYLKDGRFPRVYHRWLVGDTIYEYVRFYTIEHELQNAAVFIKTNKTCVFINEMTNTYIGNKLSDIKSHVLNVARYFRQNFQDLSVVDHTIFGFGAWGFPHEKGYLVFNKTRLNNMPAYRSITVKDTIYYYSQSLAHFSIASGFEELEEYRENIPETHKTHDGVYYINYVDEPPRILSCNKGLQEYIDQVYNNSKRKGHRRNTVIVNLIISENGQLTNAQISKSVGKEEDNAALRLCYAIPAMIPAKINSVAVPVSMNLAFRFYYD